MKKNNDGKKGLFISVEGIDGAGKSTHIKFIRQYLQQNGLKVVVAREPGGTTFGEKLREIILFNKEHIHNITELLLLFASRQELIHKVIIPALDAGECVLVDRFIDASLAYQGGGRNINIDKIFKVISLLEPQLKPDLTLLFDAPLEIAKRRMGPDKRKDRIEKEKNDFFKRVQNTYYDIAKREPHRVKIVYTDKTIQDSEAVISGHLENLLDNIIKKC